jgi:hypothetical protein
MNQKLSSISVVNLSRILKTFPPICQNERQNVAADFVRQTVTFIRESVVPCRFMF